MVQRCFLVRFSGTNFHQCFYFGQALARYLTHIALFNPSNYHLKETDSERLGFGQGKQTFRAMGAAGKGACYISLVIRSSATVSKVNYFLPLVVSLGYFVHSFAK